MDSKNKKTIGFDINSLSREYAMRVLRQELPLPKDHPLLVVPVEGSTDLVLTVEDVKRTAVALDPVLGAGITN